MHHVTRLGTNLRLKIPSALKLVFDGKSLWVLSAPGGTGRLTQLSLGGTTVGTFAAGGFPSDMIFDGAELWVADGQALLKR